jgi:hypothetical protein
VIDSYKLIDELKQIVTSLKDKKTSAVENRDEIKSLCQRLLKNVDYLNEPKCARYIRARKIKRAKSKSRTQNDFYDLKLNDFIKEKNLFGGKQSSQTFEPTTLSVDNQYFKKDLQSINKNLLELKKLSDFQSSLVKLAKLRISNSSSIQCASFPKLEEAAKMINVRKTQYEEVKISLKSKPYFKTYLKTQFSNNF